VKHTLPFLESIKHSEKNVEREKLVKAHLRMPSTSVRQIPDVENVTIIEI